MKKASAWDRLRPESQKRLMGLAKEIRFNGGALRMTQRPMSKLGFPLKRGKTPLAKLGLRMRKGKDGRDLLRASIWGLFWAKRDRKKNKVPYIAKELAKVVLFEAA